MGIHPPQREVRFELNYAKKGALLPPKGDLPPLIEGSLFTTFLYKSLKKRYFFPQKQGYPLLDCRAPPLSVFRTSFLKGGYFELNCRKVHLLYCV
jgi:hypothetical protein